VQGKGENLRYMYGGTGIDAACPGIEIETLEIRTLFFNTLGPSQTVHCSFI
jgi:hypothetical protein